MDYPEIELMRDAAAAGACPLCMSRPCQCYDDEINARPAGKMHEMHEIIDIAKAAMAENEVNNDRKVDGD